MSSSDSFKDRLKRTQSNIWKSANKLFGRNVSGGGVEDFVSGGAINTDFPGFSKNATAQAFIRAGLGNYKDFQADYKSQVTSGQMTADEFRQDIESRGPGAPVSRRTPSPIRRSASPQRGRAPAPMNLGGQGMSYQAGPAGSSSSGASSVSRGRTSQFKSPGAWSRKPSPKKTVAEKEQEKAKYAAYKANILAQDPSRKGTDIRKDYLTAMKVQKVINIDGKNYQKPPVIKRGPNSKKSPLKIVIDREYTTRGADGKRVGKAGDKFIATRPGAANMTGEERFTAFMNEVYFQSPEYQEVQRKKMAEAARPKKLNPWQQVVKDSGLPAPRRSFKAFQGYKAGSPERMAYDELYEGRKRDIRGVWEASPEYRDYMNSGTGQKGGRDVGRFFNRR